MRVTSYEDYYRFWSGGICYVDGELCLLKNSDSESKLKKFNTDTRKWPAGYTSFEIREVDFQPYKVQPGYRGGVYVSRRNSREYRYVAHPSNTTGWEAFSADPLAPIESQRKHFLGFCYEENTTSTTSRSSTGVS